MILFNHPKSAYSLASPSSPKTKEKDRWEADDFMINPVTFYHLRCYISLSQ